MLDAADPPKLIALVGSPLQALNLVEYSERFSREVDIVVVAGLSMLAPASRAQIEATLSLVSPRKIIFHEWRLRARRPRGARRDHASGVAILKANLTDRPYQFIIGEYRSAFCWAALHRLKVPATSIVVVDDGTAMLRIDRRRSLRWSRRRWREIFRGLLFLIFGVRGIAPPDALTFFTTYALEDRVGVGDTIVRNDYRTLRAELHNLPPDDDSVYVIGTPHREAGAVDEGDVELALELIRFASESTGKEVVYMAHRRERTEKLDALRDEVTVITPNVPFEIYPRVLGKRPRTVIGYYSSVFVTLTELLGESVEIIALEIPRNCINDSWLPFVDEVYRYYRNELGACVKVVENPIPRPA
ncbi:hypothetical protein [Mycolicibacterium hippocampi]|uniref:Uncharacterized protein n=1 Tax=Mycolicibacterium hippocampi TaxID=659824 RepID=A0A7I9ZLS2_9MYCO|nr:hypothetical protein [Mycolicibacterium hippocampi]GFH01934.1 hypothetical protein MHIP_24170 [Mycolicibacterium hippocampi]